MKMGQCGGMLWGLLVLAVPCLLVGCQSYELQGKAIAGPTSQVLIVDQDDPRLNEPGIPGVVVRLMLDPDRAGRRTTAGISDMEGNFAVPVDAFGAGMLEYEARVFARKPEHAPADNTFQVPAANRRLLITLAPGRDVAPSDSQYFLDETLRMSEPYLRE